jgi:hypothetical protein
VNVPLTDELEQRLQSMFRAQNERIRTLSAETGYLYCAVSEIMYSLPEGSDVRKKLWEALQKVHLSRLGKDV